MDIFLPILAIVLGVLGLWSLKCGAVFLPAEREKVSVMMELLAPKAGERIVDLGSGDGRVVIALARAGADAYGFEHNPLLVWWSRFKIHRAGLSKTAHIRWGNFWKANMGQFDGIIVFGIPYIMERLQVKLASEAHIGTRVISYLFSLPTWSACAKKSGVFLYKKE